MNTFRRAAASFAIGSIALALLTLACVQLQFSLAGTALLFLIVVVFVSLSGGFIAAACLSLAAVLSLQYFFVTPVFSFQLAGPLDVVETLVFLTTAFIISRLVAQVRRRERDVRLIMDTMPANVVVGSTAESTDYYCNQHFHEYTGYSLEDLRSRGWESVVHPDDRTSYRDTSTAAVAAGQVFEKEMRLRNARGEYRWFLRRVAPMRDEKGHITLWCGTSVDIDDRKRAEELAREQASLLDLTHDTIFVRDPNDVITYWNRGAEEFYGWTREQALGKVTHQLLHTQFQSPLEEITSQLETSGRWEGELVHVKRDGSRVTVASRWSLQRDAAGRVIGTLETNNDITDRKRAENEIKQLQDQLYRENIALREEIDRTSMFEEIVGSSDLLRKVINNISKVAATDSTVLITGETGTGKELVARAIHKRSRRSGRAFVSVNCAAVPQSLISSELFGHEKGAFTGATQRRLGRFELANGGTIFLDEVGELPPETQVALLRVLQEREFERVGGTQRVSVDVRVSAATNRDLKSGVDAGTFRADLYYRLNVFPIHVPALRDRIEDIPVLVEYFIQRYASKAGKKIRNIAKKTVEMFKDYEWPGNIRELQNVVERAVILCDDETFAVDDTWLQAEIRETPDQVALPSAMDDREREMIEAALKVSRGRVSGPSGAAARLGIPRSTLESKIRSLRIDKHQFRSSRSAQ